LIIYGYEYPKIDLLDHNPFNIVIGNSWSLQLFPTLFSLRLKQSKNDIRSIYAKAKWKLERSFQSLIKWQLQLS